MTDSEQPRKKTSLPSVFERSAVESTDPWVSVWVSERGSRGRTDVQKIFRATAIEEITSSPSTEGASRLHLYNGQVILVKMEADKLWEKIYQPDFRSAGKSVNLLEVTGAQAFPAPPTPEIGELVEGEGIFIGQHQWLSKTFNVFAAPEDLPGKRSQPDTVALVTGLTHWHGHGGTSYNSDKLFYTALETGNYAGGWIIPPINILHDNFFNHRDQGALKDSIKITAADEQPTYYSSTPDGKEYFMVMQFAAGKVSDGFRDTDFLCRPVRLVEAKP